MAIIKCPECGEKVSDRAVSCPNCGAPIESMQSFGEVKIKLSRNPAFNSVGGQGVTICQGGEVLWEGQAGEIFKHYFEKPTEIMIKYHTTLTTWGGECTGVIDPSKSRKYNCSAKSGFFGAQLVLQEVDVIDTD